MKKAIKSVLSLVVVLAAVAAVHGEEPGKSQTLKGEILCTKCSLKETPACGNAIKTTIGGTETVVYFKDAGKKASYHGKVCAEAKMGSVTGVVTTEKGKTYITPEKDGVKFE